MLAIVATGTSLKHSHHPHHLIPPAHPRPHARLATAAAADQVATFAVLRRSRAATDALPAAMLAPGLTGGRDVETFGTNVNLARRATGLTAGAAWIIPGATGMCLAAEAGTAADAPSGASCGDSAIAESGRMYVEAHGPAAASADFVAGLVPDGVDAVTITLANGTSERVAVHDNVYTAATDAAIRSVRIDVAGQAITLDV